MAVGPAAPGLRWPSAWRTVSPGARRTVRRWYVTRSTALRSGVPERVLLRLSSPRSARTRSTAARRWLPRRVLAVVSSPSLACRSNRSERLRRAGTRQPELDEPPRYTKKRRRRVRSELAFGPEFRFRAESCHRSASGGEAAPTHKRRSRASLGTRTLRPMRTLGSSPRLIAAASVWR